MFWVFLVFLIALPLLIAAYAAVQCQTTNRQSELRSYFEPSLELHFSGSMRWFPYLAMAVGGVMSLIAYADSPFGGISLIVMADAGIGSYAWFAWMGPSQQARREFHLHAAGEIGEIARSLMAYNDEAYAKYRRNSRWLKGVKPPANRMAADDDYDYVLRLIWTMVAERYAVGAWLVDNYRAVPQRPKDDATIAVLEARLAIEKILAIAGRFPGLAIKPGLLDWDVPGLNSPIT